MFITVPMQSCILKFILAFQLMQIRLKYYHSKQIPLQYLLTALRSNASTEKIFIVGHLLQYIIEKILLVRSVKLTVAGVECNTIRVKYTFLYLQSKIENRNMNAQNRALCTSGISHGMMMIWSIDAKRKAHAYMIRNQATDLRLLL